MGWIILALHTICATAWTAKVIMALPYCYNRLLRYRVACGERVAQEMVAGPPIQRGFSMALHSVMIGVLSLFGAYAFSLKRERWRFFVAYTRKDMDNLVSTIAKLYDKRRGSK